MTPKFYGSIEGTLVSITVDGEQALGIDSPVEGKTIRCSFDKTLSELVKDCLGQEIKAFGIIYQQDGETVSIYVDFLQSQIELPTIDEILTQPSRYPDPLKI